ncbi:MAG: holo-ACP synthase AcpS [Flaviflexus sp.]
MIIGVGVDLVGIESFAQQLDSPGTVYARAFTGQERRTAKNRANTSGSVAGHLAARWAAKEAFIKAWSAALIGTPPPLTQEEVDWSQIEVVSDRWGRPTLTIHEPLAAAVNRSLAERYGRGSTTWHISMSHDGGMAMATAIADRTSS